MFEFLRNGPLGRLKFVQRMLDRSGSSRRRRRLSAGTDDEDVVSETEAEVGARHRRCGPSGGDPEEHNIDCTERRVADQPAGSHLVEARPGDGRTRSAKAEAPATHASTSPVPKNEEVADRASVQAVVQRASVALSVARATAQLDIPLHARARYSIECDVRGGASAAKEVAPAAAAAAATATAAEAAADPGPPARRRSSWHSSLRQPKAKSAVQHSKLRISFRKKPSTSQGDYNVLSDDGHHFDISGGGGSNAATVSEMTPAARARLTDGHGDASALSSDATFAASGNASSGEEPPKSSQAVAEALRRSFRKTSKYIRYGTQSMTITKPATSLNWAASSSTKQTLI